MIGGRVHEVGGDEPGTDPFARLDLDRRTRTGVPEVVLAGAKTPQQTVALLTALRRADPEQPALATRCPDATLDLAHTTSPFGDDPVRIDPVGRTIGVGPLPAPRGFVAVLTGGTSDLPVAAECAATLDLLGIGHRRWVDIGVAGLGRLLRHVEDFADADCVIAVAGMEGALATVVSGLVAAPVIGVPSSVGYGVSAGGRAALDGMLASCAPGLVTVNVDNGFGAAVHAAKIVAAVHRAR